MRISLTVSAAATLVAGIVAIPILGNAADVPTPSPHQVALIPSTGSPTLSADVVISAGVDGYLHRHDGGADYLWTRFADHKSTVVTALAGVNPLLIRPAGGNVVAVGAGTTTVTMVDADAGTSRVLAIPTGFIAYGQSANTLLLRGNINGVIALEIVKYAGDGTTTTIPVTGFPAGALFSPWTHWINNAEYAVVRYSSGGNFEALVNLASGVATPIPGPDVYTYIGISGDVVVGVSAPAPHEAEVFSLSGLIAGTDVTPKTVAVPTLLGPGYALAGDHLVASLQSTTLSSATYDVPLDGSASRTLYPITELGTTVAGPNGTALVIGGSSAADWAVHHLSSNSAGALIDDGSLSAQDPVSNAGISLTRGVLHHVQYGVSSTGAAAYYSFDHALTTYPGEPTMDGFSGLHGPVASCDPVVKCATVVDGNYYGPVFLNNASASSMQVYGERLSGFVIFGITVPSGGGTVAAASGYYLIINGTSPARQYVVSTAQNAVLSSGPIGAAALWSSTLWRPGTTVGTATATDLNEPATPAKTVNLGAGCVPSDLQANNNWVYWSCGATGPAGLHNVVSGANISVPAGVALLGDGYVAMHPVGKTDLSLYDFHTGALSDPVAIGSLPVSPLADDRQFDWTVDPNSGDIAYVDGDDAVHVVDPDVPGTPATVVFNFWAGVPYAYPRSANSAWTPTLWMNRPVDSWKLTITASTGVTVATSVGTGGTRQYAMPSWDGKLGSGAYAHSGAYHWVLTATTADDGTVVAGSGTVTVECGAYTFRGNYDCGGAPAVLGVKASGEGHWYTGTATGGLFDDGYTVDYDWGTAGAWETSAVVPFGDINNDGRGDLIVRDGAGVLWADLGPNDNGNDQKVRISSGWSSYTALLTTGDLNHDGYYDLLARDKAGILWFYPGRAGNSFGARVDIGSTWAGAKQLVGVGDMTGDGLPDLLAIDSAGNSLLYHGNGKGGFSTVAQLGHGWSIYNAVVGIGDLNLDGFNDVVARDASGVLWLIPGNGKGVFGARTRISGGWGVYTHLS